MRRNIYCKELEKIVYTSGESYNHFKRQEEGEAENLEELQARQVKCVAVSPDGLHIATGDMFGYLHVYDMESGEQIKEILAHDQEVVCLDYAPFKIAGQGYLLASGSRDRLIHIFKSENDYEDINHLEDHTSSIVALKFAYHAAEKDPHKRLKIISSGADKTIIYRNIDCNMTISLYHKEGFKNNKIVSMDVLGSRVVAGHD